MVRFGVLLGEESVGNESPRTKVGSKLKIACWNINGLDAKWKDYIEQLGYDILVVSEMHHADEMDGNTGSWIWSKPATSEDRFSGVGIYVGNSDLWESRINWGSWGSRIVYCEFEAHPTNLVIIGVYMASHGT